MDGSKLLVVGIDPGTTTGYAILDLDGNLVSLRSSKNLGLNNLLVEVLKEGKAVSVGTDKAKIPSLVNLFSAKTGAKIIYPKDDLRVEEKRQLTKDFKVNDGHQNDALAASLFAHNRIKDVLVRIDKYAQENGKLSIKQKVAGLVLTKDVSIREAIEIIENNGKEEARIIKNAVDGKQLKQSDFLRLYRIIKRHETESFLLKKQNNSMKGQIISLERRYNELANIDSKAKINKTIEKSLSFKDRSIHFLENEVRNKEDKIIELASKSKKLNRILSRINEFIVLIALFS